LLVSGVVRAFVEGARGAVGVLIDYVTAHVCLTELSDAAREWVREQIGERIMRYCPRTGDVRSESGTWDSLRSDDHELSARVGSSLVLAGSPARCCGVGDTVFGSGAAAALDLPGCVEAMKAVIERLSGCELPAAPAWRVCRVDVTGNLLLPDPAGVAQALGWLRGMNAGRLKVDSRFGDSVYFNLGSRRRKAVCYRKGAHLRRMVGKPSYTGRPYSEVELDAADRLLRMELRLGSQWWQDHDWRGVTAEGLTAQWQDYFQPLLGQGEVMDKSVLVQRVRAVAKTEGQARAALACWALIQQSGWEQAADMHARPTWYRHLKLLKRAGLGEVDLAHGQVIPIRRVELHAASVDTWEQLLKRCAA
jgi:II/X family phage/plasmid replication protein